MNLLVLSQQDVEALLPMEECIDVMQAALSSTARGDAVLPLRQMVWMPDRTGMIGLMPGYLGEPKSLGLKIVSIFPGNEGTTYDSHQGTVLLFDPEHGTPLVVMDASSITAIRTAAVSGAATRALAREEAGDLAILGSGVQAATHLDAMAAARTLRRVRVWSRDPAHARSFATRHAARSPVPNEPMAEAEAAVRGADLICTTTSAREPIVRGDWLSPGAHLNAVGACFPATRELDTEAVSRARLYVDRRESALQEAGDLLIPIQEGRLTERHIVGELGDVFLGRLAGRGDPSEITLFKSLGIAIEDLAAAHHVLRKARAAGRGASLRFAEPRPIHA
jgi:ornithine cyclodeaminase/alanine dehydrogenase-like protein (mu-crystallin family)